MSYRLFFGCKGKESDQVTIHDTLEEAVAERDYLLSFGDDDEGDYYDIIDSNGDIIDRFTVEIDTPSWAAIPGTKERNDMQ